MNREQRKYACDALNRICEKKKAALEAERQVKRAALEDKLPAKAYMEVLNSNNKERALLMDKIMAYFIEHDAAHRSGGYYGFTVNFSFDQDTRDSETEVHGIETPLLRKLKKAYYDALDKLNDEYAARCAKIDEYTATLKDQVWLSDLPGELADMLKKFEETTF